jgi:hypothetical protein
MWVSEANHRLKQVSQAVWKIETIRIEVQEHQINEVTYILSNTRNCNIRRKSQNKGRALNKLSVFNTPRTHQLQLHASSRHYDRTYILSPKEYNKTTKTVRFIPTLATIRELTLCQGKNAM